MKKTIVATAVLTGFISFANSYVVILDKETEYVIQDVYKEVVETTEWTNEGGQTNCSNYPLNSDYYKDVSFSQETTCDQKQVRDINTYKENQTTGDRELVGTVSEEQTVEIKSTNQSIGTYLASSCSDIVDHNGKSGDKIYETTKGFVFCDMDYKDGSGYERTHLYKANQSLLGGCTHWRSKIAEFCSNYTDTLSFTLNKTSNAYMEFSTYNYSGIPNDANTSIITVDDVDVSYHLMSEVKHEVDLSSKTNGSKTMIIRFSHDANGSGKDNNMGVKEIYLYEK